MVLPDYLQVLLLVCLCSTTLASNIQLQSYKDKALGVKRREVQCTNPTPDSIPSCYCSHEFNDLDEYLGRGLFCRFDNGDPELKPELQFLQFNRTNNEFFFVEIEKSSMLTNFVFDENTTGKLIMEKFRVHIFDYNDETPVLFKETAFALSNSVLGSISVNGDSINVVNWDFGPGTLDNLNNLTYLELLNYDYDSGPFPPSVLFSLQELTFRGDRTILSNFAYITMPNLRRLQINDYAGSTLPANMLNNLHGLEVFGLQHSEVEIIPGDFFTYVTSCRNFVLNENKIQTIDLGSLNPNTSVDLSYNQIKQLPEKNFRIFVENVIYAPDAYGIVQLYGNQLECSCDIKWLVVDLRRGLEIFRNAQCADGIFLADVDPVVLEIECPDY